MYMIEISEKKYEKLSEHIEESLRHLGKAMSCIAEMGEPYGLGHRDEDYMPHHDVRHAGMSRYDRHKMRGEMGYREDEDDWDDDDEMGERRRRSRRTGRYMRG